MSASPTITVPNPAWQRAVDRRSVELCDEHPDGFQANCPNFDRHQRDAEAQLRAEVAAEDLGPRQ